MSSPQTFFLVQCLFYDIWTFQMEVNKKTEPNDFSVIIIVQNRSK